MESREGRQKFEQLTRDIGECSRWMWQPKVAMQKLDAIHTGLRELIFSESADPGKCMRMLLNLSSLQIDVASEAPDVDEINRGMAWAQDVLDGEKVDEGSKASAAYNLANALTSIHYLAWTEHRAKPETKAGKRTPFRLTEREIVRRTRVLNARAANSSDLNGAARSTALCNLGNSLDESGRWVEAYHCYADALEADPNNGNAAGNAAELLRRRINLGHGLLGHYAAVYDFYLKKAKDLRRQTVAIAGEETAQRWDSLELTESPGHISHEGDKLNDYQRWIKQHRLALALAVEGLGSDEPRWDSAGLDGVTVRLGEPDPPPIFSSMNVLKAEFLTVRRLAFNGEMMLLDSLYQQHPDDTGWYADTLDYSLYGEPPAMLILAQRASLDLLDKIAVAANEHFQTGLNPGNITFRSYWFDNGSGAIRKKLPLPVKGYGAAIALAELSFDICPEGLYPAAQMLRNAGTHRLVHLTHGEATGVTEDTHSTVDFLELIHACHESLRVARAAYIYLIDLVNEKESDEQSEELMSLPLPGQM
jgi:tetratricopeptide (TPR) repeat protein